MNRLQRAAVKLADDFDSMDSARWPREEWRPSTVEAFGYLAACYIALPLAAGVLAVRDLVASLGRIFRRH